jgi:hypothetical protein
MQRAGNTPAAVMMTLGQIAERDGVGKPAVSRKIAQLVERHGLQVERDQRGRVGLINIAMYDELRQRTDDPSKAQAPRNGVETQPNDSYDEALRRRTWIEAERSKFRFAAERGEYVHIDEVKRAVERAGAEVVYALDAPLRSVDEIASTATRGVNELRRMIKRMVEGQRTQIADSLDRLSTRRTTVTVNPFDDGDELPLETNNGDDQ